MEQFSVEQVGAVWQSSLSLVTLCDKLDGARGAERFFADQI